MLPEPLIGMMYCITNCTVQGNRFLGTEPEFVNLLRRPGNDSQPGGIDSLESIIGLLERLQIRALDSKDSGFPDKDSRGFRFKDSNGSGSKNSDLSNKTSYGINKKT
jgi:hypothetical protein